MSIPTKQCPQCGNSMLQDSAVCPTCGWDDMTAPNGPPFEDEGDDEEDDDED